MTRRTDIQLALPAGTPIILPAPREGLACVGADVPGRELVFAGPRPDGQWPTPAGWLPGLLGGPGNAGIDDSGWRLQLKGLTDLRCEPGRVYPRGFYVGQVASAEGITLALGWLEDLWPDRMIWVDPAVLIGGLSSSFAPVPLSDEASKIPALVSSADGKSVAAGSVTLVNRDGRAALSTNGTVVQVGDVTFDLTLGIDWGRQ